MPLSQLIRRDVVTVKPADPLTEAARLLDRHNIGSLVVVDEGAIVGMLTDRDLALRAVGHGLDPSSTEVSKIMSTPVRSISHSEGIFGAIDEMAGHSIRRMPVVDDEGGLVGLLTLDDILTLLVTEFALLEGVLLAQSKAGRRPGPDDGAPG